MQQPHSQNESIESEHSHNDDLNQQDKEIDFSENYSQKPQFMYKWWYDWNTAEYKWNLNFMFPKYYRYFKEMQKMLEELAETINKKWTEQQKNHYIAYLTDVNNYIKHYIWTKQIYQFNMFLKAMRDYSEQTNPLGAELYNAQLQYLHKRSIGYDFFQDKKRKKQQFTTKKIQQTSQQLRKQQKQKKQQQIIRTPDPVINFAQLMTRKWPQDKYGNLHTFKKQNANIVFIGHVDSGKSTLTGNILKQLNQVDDQEWLRNKLDAKQNHMEAYELAGISDVDPMERKKGITIEYAKLMFHYQKRRFTLFDAPGHKNFVPNMIMGACQADIAVLIISAKSGQFESGFLKEGQTQEHALLAKSLGVNSMVVAITKMSTVDWSQQRYNEIKSKLFPFLKDTCGYSQCQFIPIDSINNLNIHKPIENSWYKGSYFLQAIQNIKLPERNIKGPLRIPIIDKFKDVGNLYIYGKVESGAIIQQQVVTLLPQRKQFTIKQIYNAKDQRLPYAIAGENLKIKIKGLDQNDIKRGNIVCNNMNYCLESRQFKANLTVVELPEKKKLLSNGYQCVIHMHAISENVEVFKIQTKKDKDKKLVPTTFLLPGESGQVIIKVQNPICLQKFQFMANLGRFTLRDQGKTIGYGEVLKIKPAKSLLKQQKQRIEGKQQSQNVSSKSQDYINNM